MKRTVSSKEALALVLYLPGATGIEGEPIVGRTRLVKTMFLFDKEVKPSFRSRSLEFALPAFEAYDYGPFSMDVYDDVNALQSLEIISVTQVPEWDEFDVIEDLNQQGRSAGVLTDVPMMDRFGLTTRGMKFCKDALLPRLDLSQSAMEQLSTFKKRCNAIALLTLLRYVYTKYPEYTKNSLIRERVLKFDSMAQVNNEF